MSEISISVIIPCFNSSSTIKACFQSVINQTEAVDEIILIDDGSIDDTYSKICLLAENYDQKKPIVKIARINNSGVSIARNYGVSLSKSSHIAFLDSDDCWMEEKIAIQKRVLSKNNNLVICATQYKNVNTRWSGSVTFKMLLVKNYFFTPCVIVLKSVFVEIGGFKKDMYYCEDYNLWLEILYNKEAYLIDFIGAMNIIGKRSYGQSGLSGNLLKMHEGVLICYNNLYKKRMITITDLFVYGMLERMKYVKRIFVTFFEETFNKI